jgi:hypothetical protein
VKKLAFACAFLLLTTGCDMEKIHDVNAPQFNRVVTPGSYSNVIALEIVTLDGRVVTCIASHDGLACDFDHTRPVKSEASQ